ncbi:hypothetical protein D869_gp087 [Caulobacter phage CcrRogue]|uniref:Uncharacterized protein n=1 Tax=Caulobacter phage CcrRogue TaxID=2927986 RepID=K4JNC8_9CAUD|nr:hypothetical protein D869_gp014 [Caulobacter phage CcrRogue]YP_006989374.1 hypothetical protein D869_gp087 [Caulobacter phage CcrRogue]AFU86496.1 hypothetical protein CcrRogue_gp014 [Caulobacter phage CcrRogue]AFU86827.1 hypothetical protein CcrRogue_gp345 [Caulobacter phage CcrRogue]
MPPMTHPHALALIALAEKVLPLTRLDPLNQRAAAVDLIGDLYSLADSIDATAGHLVAAVNGALRDGCEGYAPKSRAAAAVATVRADELRSALEAYTEAAALALPKVA